MKSLHEHTKVRIEDAVISISLHLDEGSYVEAYTYADRNSISITRLSDLSMNKFVKLIKLLDEEE